MKNKALTGKALRRSSTRKDLRKYSSNCNHLFLTATSSYFRIPIPCLCHEAYGTLQRHYVTFNT